MPRSANVIWIPVGLVVFLGAAGRTAASGQVPDVTKLGPQVGARVPGFTLPDADGREHDLQSLMGPEGLMLVFFRSADW